MIPPNKCHEIVCGIHTSVKSVSSAFYTYLGYLQLGAIFMVREIQGLQTLGQAVRCEECGQAPVSQHYSCHHQVLHPNPLGMLQTPDDGGRKKPSLQGIQPVNSKTWDCNAFIQLVY